MLKDNEEHKIFYNFNMAFALAGFFNAIINI